MPKLKTSFCSITFMNKVLQGKQWTPMYNNTAIKFCPKSVKKIDLASELNIGFSQTGIDF